MILLFGKNFVSNGEKKMTSIKGAYQEWVWEREQIKYFKWTDKDLEKAKKDVKGFIGIKNNTKCFLLKGK